MLLKVLKVFEKTLGERITYFALVNQILPLTQFSFNQDLINHNPIISAINKVIQFLNHSPCTNELFYIMEKISNNIQHIYSFNSIIGDISLNIFYLHSLIQQHPLKHQSSILFLTKTNYAVLK